MLSSLWRGRFRLHRNRGRLKRFCVGNPARDAGGTRELHTKSCDTNFLENGAELAQMVEFLGHPAAFGIALGGYQVLFCVLDALVEGGNVEIGHRDRFFREHCDPPAVDLGKTAAYEELDVP